MTSPLVLQIAGLLSTIDVKPSEHSPEKMIDMASTVLWMIGPGSGFRFTYVCTCHFADGIEASEGGLNMHNSYCAVYEPRPVGATSWTPVPRKRWVQVYDDE